MEHKKQQVQHTSSRKVDGRDLTEILNHANRGKWFEIETSAGSFVGVVAQYEAQKYQFLGDDANRVISEPNFGRAKVIRAFNAKITLTEV